MGIEKKPEKRAGPRVPFGTLTVTPRAEKLIAEAVASRRLSSGRNVAEFERRFAELAGAREAVAVASGTDAVALALATLYDFGASRGDEVIVPALSFVATGNAVLQAGLRPVFVDIDRATLNIDVSRIEAAVTEKTRAILPVHLMGKPADMDAIDAIARRHGLAVIEDAAEAHGALYKGRSVGSLGVMAAFSLYVAHIISSVEGGMVTTGSAEMAEVLRSLRSHGRACKCAVCVLNVHGGHCEKRFTDTGEDIRFVFERIGFSSKMNEMEAAIGLGNLDAFDEVLAKRRENLLYVLERFGRFAPALTTIREEPHERIGPHAIPIVVGEEAAFTREALAGALEEAGIESRTLFASMPTQCAGFAYLGYRLGEFPVAEFMGRNGLHVGVHQDLGREHMDHVLETIRVFLERHPG